MQPDKLSTNVPGHILIVDDEEFIRSSFRLYFETMGFKVATASHGEAALRIVLEEGRKIDVVLLDLIMPGTHGVEVLKRIKELEPSIEVIIATGCGNMQSAIQALRYGAFDYITKPIVNFEEDLLKIVEEAIRHRRESTRSPSEDPSPPEVSAAEQPGIGLAQKLEELLRTSSFDSWDRRIEAIGNFLKDAFSTTTAIAFGIGDHGQLQCLATWGHFGTCLRLHGERFPLLQAASIAETIPEVGVWQSICPEASGIASPTPSPTGQPPEAMLIPLEPTTPTTGCGNVQLLVMRDATTTGSSRLELPLLARLALSTALSPPLTPSDLSKVDTPRSLVVPSEDSIAAEPVL